MTFTVAVLVHPGFQLLDAAGPIAAFEIAERFRPGSYALSLVAPGGGLVESSAGQALPTEPLGRRVFDTVVVSGGEVDRSLEALREIVGWLARARARRIASVCSGAYFLAEAGLLDGRSATTHWRSAEDFRRRYPRVRVDADRIFVRDGSAGIDLAIALIEDDLGPEIARRTAQELVVHQRRPGGQSQFSALVELGGRTGRFLDLVDWMRAHVAEPLTVERLAARAAMSPRHFARAFAAETGTTPAKAVERLRLEIARAAIESSTAPLERIARTAGFGDTGRMRRAFLRAFGLPPQALRGTTRSSGARARSTDDAGA